MKQHYKENKLDFPRKDRLPTKLKWKTTHSFDACKACGLLVVWRFYIDDDLKYRSDEICWKCWSKVMGDREV